MPVPATVVLADDHPLMLKGLNDLLSNERDFTVLAQCTNGDDALRAVRATGPTSWCSTSACRGQAGWP